MSQAGHMAKLPTVEHRDVWRVLPIFEMPTTTWIEVAPGVKILVGHLIGGAKVPVSIKILSCACQEK
jgi:hypothetical protein